MSHHLENYRLAGIDAVVAKPIQFIDLAVAMRSLMNPGINAEAPARLQA
jgi:hypothetical protein